MIQMFTAVALAASGAYAMTSADSTAAFLAGLALCCAGLVMANWVEK